MIVSAFFVKTNKILSFSLNHPHQNIYFFYIQLRCYLIFQWFLQFSDFPVIPNPKKFFLLFSFSLAFCLNFTYNNIQIFICYGKFSDLIIIYRRKFIFKNLSRYCTICKKEIYFTGIPMYVFLMGSA